MRKILAATIIISVVLLCMLSCQGEPQSQNEAGDNNPGLSAGSPAGGADGDASPEYGYEFPDVKFGGADFTILNRDYPWLANIQAVVEEITGDLLNDAIYYRTRRIEELFDVNLKENTSHPDDIIRRARTLILAGDDTHDAMFICHGWNGFIGSLAFEGFLYDLNDISELNLDKPWWNQNILGQLKISDSSALYFALNDIETFNMQSMMNLFINERIAYNLGLEIPYNLVREGRWTLDEYERYIKAATNLNGDGGWAWEAGGNSIYGQASFHMGATAWLLGTDVNIIGFDNNNMPYFAAENEHFFNAVNRLAGMFSVEGQYFYEDTAGGAHRINDVFLNGRSLFVDSTINATDSMRDMEDQFGILPMPKFDESQENYHTAIHTLSTFTVIPVTNANPGKAAIILDAKAYLTYQDVRPAYYEVALPHKYLRNDDSIDMLDILMNTRSIHIGYVYNWTTDFLNNDMRMEIQSGNPNVASLIERRRDRIIANIERTLEFFEG